MDVFDLTHYIEEDMTVYDEKEEAKLYSLASIDNEGYNITKIEVGSHTGTHIDSPRHIFSYGKSLDQYKVEEFIGSSFIIDCRGRENIDLDFLYSYEDEINRSSYILLKTGWEKYWKRDDYFSGYPTLTKEAAIFLGNIKSLCGIGVDCISVDKEDDENLSIHKLLLENNKLIVENLCGLTNIEGRYNIILAPMKYKNSDGASCRAYLTK